MNNVKNSYFSLLVGRARMTLVETLISLSILSLILTGVYQTLGYMMRSFRMDNSKKVLHQDIQRCTTQLLDAFNSANPNFGALRTGGVLADTQPLGNDRFYYRLTCDPMTDNEQQVFDFTIYGEDGTPELVQGWLFDGSLYLTRENSFEKRRLLSDIVSFNIACYNKFESRTSGAITLRDADAGLVSPSSDRQLVGALLVLDIECLTNTGGTVETEKLVGTTFKANLKVPAVPVND